MPVVPSKHLDQLSDAVDKIEYKVSVVPTKILIRMTIKKRCFQYLRNREGKFLGLVSGSSPWNLKGYTGETLLRYITVSICNRHYDWACGFAVSHVLYCGGIVLIWVTQAFVRAFQTSVCACSWHVVWEVTEHQLFLYSLGIQRRIPCQEGFCTGGRVSLLWIMTYCSHELTRFLIKCALFGQ